MDVDLLWRRRCDKGDWCRSRARFHVITRVHVMFFAKSFARFAGSDNHFMTLILGLAPQALCWRPLRGLRHRKCSRLRRAIQHLRATWHLRRACWRLRRATQHLRRACQGLRRATWHLRRACQGLRRAIQHLRCACRRLRSAIWDLRRACRRKWQSPGYI